MIQPLAESVQALEDAIPLIQRGWCQKKTAHYRADGTAQYCIFGAVTEVLHAKERESDYDFIFELSGTAYAIRAEAMDLVEATVGQNAVSFNDEPGRTQEEVLTALRETVNRYA